MGAIKGKRFTKHVCKPGKSSLHTGILPQSSSYIDLLCIALGQKTDSSGLHVFLGFICSWAVLTLELPNPLFICQS